MGLTTLAIYSCGEDSPSQPGESSQCIDYGDYLHLAGSVDTPGLAASVTISGTLAYVADEASGLQVIDITNPQSPQIVGSVGTPGAAADVDV